jgi:FemAB-related protein (PEP-CTERM system-associated)
LKHRSYLLVAKQNGQAVGVLPLAYVKSLLFGRYLVGLPYVNSAGVIAESDDVARVLVDRAAGLADQLKVKHLELRHERELEHRLLLDQLTSKVHMRLKLPSSADDLWEQLKSKVRNKVKKGEKQSFSIHWGAADLLPDFYEVFSHNMRDLGTPVFGKQLFREILTGLPDEAELCVVRSDDTPVAAALLIHGEGRTEVPSASSLRAFNSTNVNDWMYWHLLKRSIERGQVLFDFGRTTVDSNTFTFKKKWGAKPEPAVWQYYVRKGSVGDMRWETGKFDRMVARWQRLPVWLTRLIGPKIIRGIP